jgi:hypothetical protein
MAESAVWWNWERPRALRWEGELSHGSHVVGDSRATVIGWSWKVMSWSACAPEEVALEHEHLWRR